MCREKALRVQINCQLLEWILSPSWCKQRLDLGYCRSCVGDFFFLRNCNTNLQNSELSFFIISRNILKTTRAPTFWRGSSERISGSWFLLHDCVCSSDRIYSSKRCNTKVRNRRTLYPPHFICYMPLHVEKGNATNSSYIIKKIRQENTKSQVGDILTIKIALKLRGITRYNSKAMRTLLVLHKDAEFRREPSKLKRCAYTTVRDTLTCFSGGKRTLGFFKLR